MGFQRVKVVTWTDLDPITSTKLNDMVGNDTLVQENMIRGLYTGYGSFTREQGVRVVSGLKGISIKKHQSANAIVALSDVFSANCRPVITTTVYSKVQRDISITMSARGSTYVLPNHTGFDIHARLTKKATCSFYVAWTALGWIEVT